MSEPVEGAEKARRFAKNLGVVSGYTMASRVTGLVRDTVFGHFFGVSHATDAFLMAFSIPNTFRMLVAEGSLTVAFLPVFKKTEQEQGPEAGKRLMSQALGVFPMLTALVCVLGMLLADPLVHAFAAGFAKVPGKLEQTVLLTRWMFFYLVMISFVALSMGALNARRHFASSAASPMIFNVFHTAWIVVATLVFQDVMWGVSFGVLLGGAAQVVLQWAALRRAGLWTRPSFGLSPEVRRILLLMGPALAATAVYQLNIMALRLFTSFLGEGAVTFIYNADRFFQLPLGVFGIAIATVSLPELAEAHQDKAAALQRTLTRSLRLNNFISIPSAVGLVALALPISATVLQHGQFTHDMARNTAQALIALAAGLVAVSGIRIAAQAFFAMQDTRTPALCGAVGLVANLAYAPALAARYDFVGLALAISLSAWTQLLVELLLLRLRLGRIGAGELLVTGARGLFAATLMGAAAYAMAGLGDWERGFTLLNTAVLGLACAVGGAVYALAQAALRAPELTEVLARLRRRTSAR